MNARRFRAAATAAALLVVLSPGAALAAPKEFDSVSDKPAISLDPSAAYLLVQTWSDTAGATPLTFIRMPDEAEIADYRGRREAAFAKAHAKWVRSHAAWVQQYADFKAGKTPGQGRPIEPIEPNEFNLVFPALATENMVTLGPIYRLAKTNGRSTYLERMKPGRYVFYGPVATFPQPIGTCLCMGSIGFELKAGEITNAGMVTLNFLAARDPARLTGQVMPKNELDLPDDLNLVSWTPPVEGAAVDPRLSAYKVVAADIRAAGRMPNYYGLTIDRMTELPGVLAYRRDQVIDAKSGEAVAPFNP